MEFVNVEGERIPYVMYKPFVYSNIVDCSNHFTIFCPNGEVKVIKKKKEYGKEIDVLMRDPKRIAPFLADLGTIWANCCPDWRFGQIVENVFGEMDYVPFMLEEDRMLEEFHNYFEERNGSGRIRRTTNEKTRKEKKKCQKLLNMVNIQKRINTLVKSVGVNLNIGIIQDINL